MRGSRREVQIARRDPLPWLIAAAAIAAWVGLRRGGLSGLERRVVIVHVPNGPSLKGLLVGATHDSLQLARASHLDSKTDLGGDVFVPRLPGVWVQTVQQEP